MWRRWLLRDLASILLAVSLECRGLAGWQEPCKANFCLDFGLRSKWEPAKLSAFPHAVVPSCPAPRLTHTTEWVEREIVASMFPNKPPQPCSRWWRYACFLLLTFLFSLFFQRILFFFFLMLLFYDSKCSQNRSESMTSVLFWSLLIEIVKCYFCLYS